MTGKWHVALVIALVVLALSGCREQPEQRRIMTPTESDLQEFIHEVEVVDSDAIRLRSDVERVRKILVEMEQSLDRVNNSTREIQKTIARLQGRPIEDVKVDRDGLGTIISWIIALLLLLVVVPIFVLKYLQTRQETRNWANGRKHSDPAARSTDSDLVDTEFTVSGEPVPFDSDQDQASDGKDYAAGNSADDRFAEAAPPADPADSAWREDEEKDHS